MTNIIDNFVIKLNNVKELKITNINLSGCLDGKISFIVN